MSERLLGIRPFVAVAGLLGLAAAIGLFPIGRGAEAPKTTLSRPAVENRAREAAQAFGIDTSGLTAIVRTTGGVSDDIDRFVRRNGRESFESVKASAKFLVPIWSVRFRTDALSSDLDDDPSGLEITLDERGEVLAIDRSTVPHGSEPLSRDAARATAVQRLSDLGIDLSAMKEPTAGEKAEKDVNIKSNGQSVEIGDSDSSDRRRQRDKDEEKSATTQKFVWKGEDPRYSELRSKVTATVNNDGLAEYARSTDYEGNKLPSDFVGIFVEGTIFALLSTVLVVLLIGAMLFRLLSRDYVSVQRAALVAGIYAVSVGLYSALTISGDNSIILNYVGQTCAAFFSCILVYAAWLAGEADAYYAWGQQSTEAALAMLTGRWRARQLARESMEGFLWGWILLGVLVVLTAAVSQFVPSLVVFRSRPMSALDVGPLPFFWVSALPYVAFYAVVCLLFVPAWVHRMTRSAILAIVAGGFVGGILAAVFKLADVRVGDVPASLSWGLALALATCAITARRGWWTAAVATFCFTAYYYGLSAFWSCTASGKLLIGSGLAIATAPAIVALVAGPKRLPVVVVREAPPARVSRMLELVRREEELDIARRVQNGLLPSGDPQFEGFEIAGVCRPANEVGGDYFDYFKLTDGRFGVAVGDVSGKGIPAAFSMTLTKGFMEVAAADVMEPDLVLAEANSYLRGNLTRGTFVTMAYAVLDPESRIVTCARAGHNPPALLRKGQQPEFVELSGPALGAADADVFSELVQLRRFELNHGDALVFYTDGVTEAMNPEREQFGEERLLASLEQHRTQGTARELAEALVVDLNTFAEHADQHDDITVVVIKVAA